MGTAPEPFINAHQHVTHSHAVMAVEVAFSACENRPSSSAQLSDLADAIEAVQAGQYRAAVILAKAAISDRNLCTAMRPLDMTLNVAQIRSLLDELRARGHSS